MTIKGFFQRSWSKELWLSIFFLLVCLGLVCPGGIWPLELLQAFSPYLSCLGIALIWRAGRSRNLLAAVLSLSAIALSISSVGPYLPWNNIAKGGSSDLKAGVFNLYHHNSHHGDALSTLLGTQCDIMAVLEVSEAWDSVISAGLTDLYPFAVRMPHAECCYGMSIYSRLHFEADTVLHFTRDPVIRITVNIQNQATDIWVVHTRPPIFPNETEERNLLMTLVAEEIAKRDCPAILMGDLNIVPWAQHFQKMAQTAGLSDSRQGYLATYPMDIGIPLIPIDHILHSSDFSTAFCETISIPGSDHKGLVAGLTIN